MTSLPTCFPAMSVSTKLLLVMALLTSAINSEEKPTPLTVPEQGHVYPVSVGAEHHIVQGRISSEAKPGTLVPSNVIMEGEEDADLRVHLRVEIRDSKYKRPHVYHPDIVINATDPLNPQFEHPVITFLNSSLPYGMEFVVVHTNAFYITPERYIAVNDFGDLGGDTRIHFDVLLKDKLSETPYVSNSLPFVVEIEYPRVEANPNAALFAGVLILTILVISLVIPFGVRAKRRHKAGKPICGCGSAEDTSDCGSMGSQPEFMKNRAMSIGGKDNLAMMLDHARFKQARPSEYELHQTIQNRMVRSESSLHFQPQWLDPQLSDYYHRPDFSYLEQLHQQQLLEQQQQQQQQHSQHQYQKHHGGASKMGAAGGSSNSSPPSYTKSFGASSTLAPPSQSGAHGHHGNGGGGSFGVNGNPNVKYSPNTARLSNGGLVHPDVLNLMNARRNSASAAGIHGQMYPAFIPGPSNPLLGQSFGGSTSSINRLGNSGSTNGLAFFRAPRGTNSNRSSTNSLYTYPANFNQGLDIPMNKLGAKKRSGSEEKASPTGAPEGAQSGVAITISASSSTANFNGDMQSDSANKEASSPSDSGNASPSTSGYSNAGFQPDQPMTKSKEENEITEESARL